MSRRPAHIRIRNHSGPGSETPERGILPRPVAPTRDHSLGSRAHSVPGDFKGTCLRGRRGGCAALPHDLQQEAGQVTVFQRSAPL